METAAMYSNAVATIPESPTSGFLVWRLSTKWRAAVDRAVAPLGLTHAQYSLLASLFGMQRTGVRPTQRALAEHTGLEPIYVSKLARALEAAGFIERSSHPTDSRAVQLALTENGRTVTRQAVRIVHDLHERLIAPLGGPNSRQAREFAAMLQKLLNQELD
jgi:DNA-binding MarR family transcriptional regulator